MLHHLLTLDGLVSLLTLTLMEIVLGIDNIIFISIVAGKLPEALQKRAWYIGLGLALIFRILLLLSITWIVQFKEPLLVFHQFSINFDLSLRDLILICGGLFLMYKTVGEMHHKLEGEDDEAKNPKATTLGQVLVQIVLLDMVFSFDSILTAVGLVDPDKVIIMILAVVFSMIVMLFAAEKISSFVNRHPSIKMLALSFLMMIGFMLVAEGFGQHVEKGYIYFAMAFSLIVELLNMRVRKKKIKAEPVQLRSRMVDEDLSDNPGFEDTK